MIDICNGREGYNKNDLNEIFRVSKKVSPLDLENQEQVNKFDKFAFVVSPANVKRTDILLINQYINIYRDKVIGWFYLDGETKF